MKKNILFILNNLNCGGAEKALISLLETIDFKAYNVDLFLFKHEGAFLNKVPKNVNILDEPKKYIYFDMPAKMAIFESIKNKDFDLSLTRGLAGIIFKTEKNSARCEQKVWKYVQRSIKPLNKVYDVAIGFLEKNPIYFCIDKVKAKKKIGFIHTDYEKIGMDAKHDEKYMDKLDLIVSVSKECVNVLKKLFPQFKNKIKLMYNIVSPHIINKLAQEKVELDTKGITIVSVGRLHHSKGFELAIEACELLIRNRYEIKWFVIGEGEERKKLESLIEVKKLGNVFKLIGLKENPYPFMKQCDIYVQTSLFEGHCLTIQEAKILNKPIVSTNFTAVYGQINSGVNGLLVKKDAESIYKGIKELIDNNEFKQFLSLNLAMDNFGTDSEIEKFYAMINS